jgi:hypothetical protein
MNIKFTKLLLEKVIKTNVKFVDKVLEKAKKKIQKSRIKDDDFVEKILNIEFDKVKSDKFDSIKFLYDNSGPSQEERELSVYISQGFGTNTGEILILYANGIHKVFEENFKY